MSAANPLTIPDGWRLAERLNVFTTLAVRFWDPVANAQVTDGLVARIWPEGVRTRAARATRTAGGLYAFAGVPGMADVEYAERGGSNGSPPRSRNYVVEVTDPRKRFLPTSFVVGLPHDGIYPSPAVSSPAGSGQRRFVLFSAPTRPLNPGIAVIRALLEERETRQPARHAVLKVELPNGRTVLGIADRRGVATVGFPYPKARYTNLTSPPSPPRLSGTPLPEQQWPLTVRILYEPDKVTTPVPARHARIDSVLEQQAARTWLQETGSGVFQWTVTLQFGEPLVLRTDGLSGLLVASATTSHQ